MLESLEQLGSRRYRLGWCCHCAGMVPLGQYVILCKGQLKARHAAYWMNDRSNTVKPLYTGRERNEKLENKRRTEEETYRGGKRKERRSR